MNYKITTLVENCVYGRKLQAEQVINQFKSTVRVKDFVSGFYCRIIHFVV